MHRELRYIIREMIQEIEEEEGLDEFSGVAALGGGPATPLGTDARYPDSDVGRKKRKKIKEAATMSSIEGLVAGPDFSSDSYDDGDISSEDTEDDPDSPLERKIKAYHRSLHSLARAYGGSEPPLKTLTQSRKFLLDRF